MPALSKEGHTIVDDVATRHGFSQEAVTHVLVALDQGGGSQAQFNHWELGGMGQWSMGGMVMIGDMFNNGLKARVDGLCSELSSALSASAMFQPAAQTSYQAQSQGGGFGQSSLFVPGTGSQDWWPTELGQPGSVGAQNDLKYAYFPMMGRLAILLNGQVTLYDTGQHQIGGFGQQQGGDQSLTFTSQFGVVRVADLPVVDISGQATSPAEQPPQPEPTAPADSVSDATTDILTTLEKLGELRDKGILTDDEFAAKKAELLARL